MFELLWFGVVSWFGFLSISPDSHPSKEPRCLPHGLYKVRFPSSSSITNTVNAGTCPSVTILTVLTAAFLVSATCHQRCASVLGVLAQVPSSPSMARAGEDPARVDEWTDRPPSARLLPGEVDKEDNFHMI